MQTWGDAYRRLREQRKFRAWFGVNGQTPGPNDFTYKAFTLVFPGVTGRTGAGAATAPIFGPRQVIFDKGAVVLAITSGAYVEQEDVFTAPSVSYGRRDLFKLFFAFTSDESLTVLGSVLDPVTGAAINVQAFLTAEALMGEGIKDEFPRDLMVPPSTGFDVSVQSNAPATIRDTPLPPLFVHVVFHVLVPKG